MNLVSRIANSLRSTSKTLTNKFNKTFFKFVGSNYSEYDPNQTNYLDHGYNENSVVYSIAQQMATKTASVPYFIKEVKNEQKQKAFISELQRYNGESAQQKLLINSLKKKAYGIDSENDGLPMPLDRPNALQSWSEFFSMYKTYLRICGNAYIYLVSPEGGPQAGEPLAWYLLPSHLVQITLKPNATELITESPVKGYMIIKDTYYEEFEAKNVVHIKLPNPNFSSGGEELYGQSPLRAVLRNINSSNEATVQNLKLLKNSGVYGFIHGKQSALSSDQAGELKSRLREMDENAGRLGRIAGISSEIGFTRLSLTTEELRPFDFLNYDQKQICNAMGWSDKLLNSDDGAKYDNIKEFKKDVIVSNIMPDLCLLEEAINTEILPRYKKYRNVNFYFDASYLPEMQLDMKYLTEWLSKALADGVINRVEYREALNYEIPEEQRVILESFTVSNNLITLEDALLPTIPDVITPGPNDEKKKLSVKFDPNQPRDRSGKWTTGGGGGGSDENVNSDVNYRMQHQMGWDKDYNSTLDNITNDGNLIPLDIFEHPEWYANMGSDSYRESWEAILKANGNPDMDIVIYRGVPTFVDNINIGDWVSLSKTYAKEHSFDLMGTGKDGHVISQIVKVRDIIWDGNDINEFAFLPKKHQK